MNRFRLSIIVFVCAILAACAGTPSKKGMSGARFVASPNFNDRQPNLVVIHHTGDSTLKGAMGTLTSAARKVSAHYIIGRNGEIVQLVDERDRAWHAGVAWWGGSTDINSTSIGIELDNNGNEPYADAQITALLKLLADLRTRYRIPPANYVGHADVTPGRKVDPSAWFPWRRLAEHGFGLWCMQPTDLLPIPSRFDMGTALTALGYNPNTPEASRKAFLLHYTQAAPINAREQEALAACLLEEHAKARVSSS